MFRNGVCTLLRSLGAPASALNDVLSDLHVWEFIHYDDNTWRWRKLASDGETVLLESPRCFDELDECLHDAEDHGFGAIPQ